MSVRLLFSVQLYFQSKQIATHYQNFDAINKGRFPDDCFLFLFVNNQNYLIVRKCVANQMLPKWEYLFFCFCTVFLLLCYFWKLFIGPWILKDNFEGEKYLSCFILALRSNEEYWKIFASKKFLAFDWFRNGNSWGSIFVKYPHFFQRYRIKKTKKLGDISKFLFNF